MFDHRHYVPILKAKKGELDALSDVAADVKAALTPLIEVPEIPWDFEEEAPLKTIDKHIEKLAKKLTDAWHDVRPFFVDMPWWEHGDSLMADGSHPLQWLGDQCHAAGLHLIPVTGPARDAAYQHAAHAVVARHHHGLCIRIEPDDFDRLFENPSAVLDALRGPLPFQEVDILIDMRAITEDLIPTVRYGVLAAVRSIPHVTSWRTLTLASSAFPKNLSGFTVGFGSVERADYGLWQAITANRGLVRKPTFADYAIQAPEIDDIDPRVMRMSASLRYTHDNEWVIGKGRNVRDHTYEEYRRICQLLVQRQEFSGAGYSAGDDYMQGCAAGAGTPGNATTWRWVGTNHHLTFVVRQLAAATAGGANPAGA